jgi:DNA mismatch endonuclease, patch repair protein
MDVHTPEIRSKNMSAIKGKDTKLEMVVRSYLHNKNLRHTLHNKNLPGKPDLTYKKYNTVVFINSCFWHVHKNCEKSNFPENNSSFWRDKLLKNVERDKRNIKELKKIGWNVKVIWGCQTDEKNLHKLYKSIISSL